MVGTTGTSKVQVSLYSSLLCLGPPSFLRFDNLFEHTKSKEPAAFRKSNPRHGVKDVPALAKRIASVLIAVNPDVLCVEEGPSCIEKMQLFVDTYLGGAYSCVTGGSHGTQVTPATGALPPQAVCLSHSRPLPLSFLRSACMCLQSVAQQAQEVP